MPIKANASAPDIASCSAGLLHGDVVLGAERKPETTQNEGQQKTKQQSAGIIAIVRISI